jgi:hypothetical protein
MLKSIKELERFDKLSGSEEKSFPTMARLQNSLTERNSRLISLQQEHYGKF